MIRTPDSNCLLCIENKSTHKNSHIVPRFLVKDILGDSNKKKGYSLDQDKNGLNSEPEQDTPKEKYILCPDCEKYFQVLETDMANTLFHNLRDPNRATEFEVKFVDNIKYKLSLLANPKIFHLFIYSIIWRCSISNYRGIKGFKFSTINEEAIRQTLLLHKCTKKTEISDLIINKKASFVSSVFTFTTREDLDNSTDNLIGVSLENNDIYHFMLGNYRLLFSFSGNGNDPFDNIIPSNNKIKIRFISNLDWISRIQVIANDWLKNILNNNYKL